MRRLSARWCWIALLACTVAACDSKTEHAAVSVLQKAPAHIATGQGADVVTPEGEAAAIDMALLPDNSAQMFERLGAIDRQLVEDFYRNYGRSVMSFNNKQELLWLIRQGYPMPDDILEASTQSDQELQERYAGGDVMAGYFLLDRKAAAAAKDPPDFTTAWQTDHFSNELLARGGAFAGYAYYRYHSQQPDSTNSALAGLLWADWQGDYRAGLELMELTGTAARARGEPLPGPASVAFAYQTLLSIVRARNPAVLGRRIDPLLNYKNGQGAAPP